MAETVIALPQTKRIEQKKAAKWTYDFKFAGDLPVVDTISIGDVIFTLPTDYIANYVGAWGDGTYAVNDVVIDIGLYYRCILAHVVSGPAPAPDSDLSHWESTSYPPPGPISNVSAQTVITGQTVQAVFDCTSADDNTEHKIVCTITSSSGKVVPRDVILVVRPN